MNALFIQLFIIVEAVWKIKCQDEMYDLVYLNADHVADGTVFGVCMCLYVCVCAYVCVCLVWVTWMGVSRCVCMYVCICLRLCVLKRRVLFSKLKVDLNHDNVASLQACHRRMVMRKQLQFKCVLYLFLLIITMRRPNQDIQKYYVKIHNSVCLSFSPPSLSLSLYIYIYM